MSIVAWERRLSLWLKQYRTRRLTQGKIGDVGVTALAAALRDNDVLASLLYVCLLFMLFLVFLFAYE